MKIFEDEASDQEARMKAREAHAKLVSFLETADPFEDLMTSNAFGGSFAVSARRAGLPYNDLVILFSPSGNNHGFGELSDGRKFISISILKGPSDPKFLHSRFNTGGKKAFIHEFMHYWLSSRKGETRTSADALHNDGLKSYYNDPDETNAYFQEAAHEFEDLIRVLVKAGIETQVAAPTIIDRLKRYMAMSVPKMVEEMKRFADPTFIAHADPKTMRAFEKRAARFIQSTLRPQIVKGLERLSEFAG